MRQLLNTLFVTSEDIYLSLDGENVVASREHQEAARYAQPSSPCANKQIEPSKLSALW